MSDNTREKYDIIKSSKLFSENWYKSQYLKNSSEDPIMHYITTGCDNNLNPSPDFDTKWYLEDNPDVAKIGMNPLIHYILHGRKEGRMPNPSFDIQSKNAYDVILFSGLFDDEWFHKYYSLDKNVNAIMYYLNYYSVYGLNPSQDFDSIWYLEENPNVKKIGMNPFVHYILHGRKEGRLPKLL